MAKRYFIPRQFKQTGLNDKELKITGGAIYEIIRYYTREAGVRALEREIAKLCRKVVKEIVMEESTQKKSEPKSEEQKKVITVRNLEHYLGVKRYRFGLAETCSGGDGIFMFRRLYKCNGPSSFAFGIILKQFLRGNVKIV